jgi:cell shape-determining protein MreC
MFLGLISPWVISSISYVILYPFHATSVWVKTSDSVLPTYLRSKADLVKELEDLRIKISTSVGTEQSIQRLIEENMDLRSMLRMEKSEDRLVARVLKRPNILPYDLLQIDKGSEDGVVVGAPVYSGLDSLIGIVVSVTNTHSFVDLFTSPDFTSTAFIFGPDIFAPIEGMGGGVARVKLPQGVSIKVGQLVILPGVSSAVYGEIIEVQNEPTQPEQYGYIAPPLGINNLLYVSVDTKSVSEIGDVVIDQDLRRTLRQETIASTTVIVSASSTNSVATSTTDEIIEN